MPNWAFNDLYVRGNPEKLKRFKLAAEDDKDGKTAISLNKLHPMPIALESTTSPSREPNPALIRLYGFDNWYDWHIHNWGCKWDVEAELIEDKGKVLQYYFESPWSPPIEAFIKISEDFPGLTFKLRFEEESRAFKGAVWFKNGEIIKERRYKP